MTKLTNSVTSDHLGDLVQEIKARWPEAVMRPTGADLFATGLESFDRLFPSGGIPYGQLIELTGPIGSGKMSLLWKMVASLSQKRPVAYVDLSKSFFALSALLAGVDPERLIIARPDSLAMAARTTELIMQHRLCGVVVCDLVRMVHEKSAREILNIPWCHRLRSRTARAKGLVIFVTENDRTIIPPSMVALRLETGRLDERKLLVRVGRSRISPEGREAEVTL